MTSKRKNAQGPCKQGNRPATQLAALPPVWSISKSKPCKSRMQRSKSESFSTGSPMASRPSTRWLCSVITRCRPVTAITLSLLTKKSIILRIEPSRKTAPESVVSAYRQPEFGQCARKNHSCVLIFL